MIRPICAAERHEVVKQSAVGATLSIEMIEAKDRSQCGRHLSNEVRVEIDIGHLAVLREPGGIRVRVGEVHKKTADNVEIGSRQRERGRPRHSCCASVEAEDGVITLLVDLAVAGIEIAVQRNARGESWTLARMRTRRILIDEGDVGVET